MTSKAHGHDAFISQTTALAVLLSKTVTWDIKTYLSFVCHDSSLLILPKKKNTQQLESNVQLGWFIFLPSTHTHHCIDEDPVRKSVLSWLMCRNKFLPNVKREAKRTLEVVVWKYIPWSNQGTLHAGTEWKAQLSEGNYIREMKRSKSTRVQLPH